MQVGVSHDRIAVLTVQPDSETESDFDEIKDDGGALYRAFVCQTINPFGLPAKDRSGRLDVIEEPHLGRLFTKIMSPARPLNERLTFERPSELVPTNS